MSRSRLFDEYLDIVSGSRSRLQRIFFCLATAGLLLNIINHQTLTQIGGNPIYYQSNDLTYLLFMLMGIPQLFGSTYPLLLDVLLISSCMASAVWPRQTISVILFIILYFLYFVIYNMAAGHHYHIVGILFMSMPFMIRPPRTFAFSFAFIRFVFCFIMLSAGLWKILRGNLTNDHHFYSYVALFNAENTVSQQTSLPAAAASFAVSLPGLLHILWIFGIAIECFFAAGLFTFRFDRLLIIFYGCFFIGGWLLLGAYNYENALLLLTMLPIARLASARPHVSG